MLSSLESILDIKNILKQTDLDEKCAQILLFLLFAEKDEFSHNQLRKILNDNGLPFLEPTFTKHLDHLEKRRIITRDKSKRSKTVIRLNIENLDQELGLKKEVKLVSDHLKKIEGNLSGLDVKEIYEELKHLHIENASQSLFLKLCLLNNQLKDDEFFLLNSLFYTYYEWQISLYLEELKKRSLPERLEALNLYLKPN
jgi:hypothetical protein